MVGGGVGTGGVMVGGGVASGTAGGVCDAGCGTAMGCGTGAGCGTGCEVATGPAVMTFVGVGAGDYITETSYTYVGKGAGLYAMVAPKRSLVGYWVMGISVILIILLAIFVRPAPTTTTTPFTTTWTTTPVPQPKECLFWGDPHILTFDGARPSFYGEGEYWVVRSDTVLIQGRYMGTKYTHGLSATNKVVVSGPFIQGHKIEVGTLESGVLEVDGQSVFTGFPSSYTLPNGLGTVTYSEQGEVVDKAGTGRWPKRIVHMSLPQGVDIMVFRWKNYLDMKIVTVKIDGMDGACGNFNADPSDDTTLAIMGRVGARVSRGDLLFSHHAHVVVSDEMRTMLRMNCHADKRNRAESSCRTTIRGASDEEITSCMYDECFGQMEHAQETAKQYD